MSGAEVGLGMTDNWATPTELNVTWLGHAKEPGYMLPAAGTWCGPIPTAVWEIITLNITGEVETHCIYLYYMSIFFSKSVLAVMICGASTCLTKNKL